MKALGFKKMHRSCCALACLLVAGLPLRSFGREPNRASREALVQTIRNIVGAPPLASARVGVLVKSLEDGSTVFAKNADELLNPASNVKLVTAAAALVKMGVDYRFETEFSTDGPVRNGRTKTLYVRGKGDPTITTERLYGMVGDLVHEGLNREVGDIVLDDTWFDEEPIAPGYDQEDGDRAYLALPGALALNWNAIAVIIRPGDAPGAKASVEVEPPSSYVTVDNKVTTGERTQRRFVVAATFDTKTQRQVISATGMISSKRGTWTVYRKVDRPTQYFGQTLQALLKARGVRVLGRVRLGKAPANAKPYYVASSETLDLVVKKLNKHSSNFIAEQLVEALGAVDRDSTANRAAGLRAVESFLEREVRMPPGSYVMKNGSGLNDANRFSAAQLVAVLTAMWHRFPTMPEYLSALGIAGKDGTIHYRFDGTEAAGMLRAKTGTLENVSALSGFVQAQDGERFVFAIIVNDLTGRASAATQAIDDIGVSLAAANPPAGLSVQTVAGPPVRASEPMPGEVLKTKMATYAAMGQRADPRNLPFLRSAWRAERNPLLRAAIADAAYQSDPRESSTVHLVLESAQAEALLPAARVARSLALEPPLLGPLSELASNGSTEAAQRLVAFGAASSGDLGLAGQIGTQLAWASELAPNGLIQAFAALSDEARPAGIEVLGLGFSNAPKLRTAFQSALDSASANGDAGAGAISNGLGRRLGPAQTLGVGGARPLQTPAAVSTLPPG